jgi:hypothetical protein
MSWGFSIATITLAANCSLSHVLPTLMMKIPATCLANIDDEDSSTSEKMHANIPQITKPEVMILETIMKESACLASGEQGVERKTVKGMKSSTLYHQSGASRHSAPSGSHNSWYPDAHRLPASSAHRPLSARAPW